MNTQRPRLDIWALLGHLFPKLKTLNLANNHLRGKIPWERLAELVQEGPLRALHLGYNKFDVAEEIRPIVYTLSQLEELNLGHLGYKGTVTRLADENFENKFPLCVLSL